MHCNYIGAECEKIIGGNSSLQCTWLNLTRSRAVARISDRTASQHLRGHVTSSVTWPFDSLYAISYWWSFGIKPLSL